jgi:hypothetical protein
MFDHSSYSKYLFKHVNLQVVFEFSLLIKQIIAKYVIIFLIRQWSNINKKINNDNNLVR